MAKKSAKIAVTYIVTMIMTFLIIGGVGIFMMNSILNSEPQQGSTPSLDPLVSTDEYTPSPEDSRTTLFIFDSEKRISGVCFMIIRMAAEDRKLILMPIPSDTYAEVDGTSDSIYEFYRNGGTGKAVKAVESALGIKTDYYVKLDNNSFASLVDIFGGVDYDIPYNMIYSDQSTGEEIVFREGRTYLDSNGLRKLFIYPLYKSGEEDRARVVGIAATDLINGNTVSGFSSNMDNYFSIVINSTVETNYTAYDYAEQSDVMKYIADNPERIAQYVGVSGVYDENSHYVLEESFLKAVPEWLKLESSED